MESKMKPKKKAQLGIGDLKGIAVVFVLAGLVIVFGLQIVGDVGIDIEEGDCTDTYEHWDDGDEQCLTCNATYTTFDSASNTCNNGTATANMTATRAGFSAEYNATTQTSEGTSTFPEKFGILATIVIASIIIGLLIRSFGKS